MASEDFFGQLINLQATLRRHGFEKPPSEEEIFAHILELDDKLDALFKALNLKPVKDYRGRWRVEASDGMEARLE